MAKKKRLSEREKVMRDIPREPVLFRNYDYTDEEPNETSPGGGLYHGPMDKYKSVKEFIDKRRKQRRNTKKRAMRFVLLDKLASRKRILVIDNDQYRHDIFRKTIKDADITSTYGFDDTVNTVAKQPPFDEIYFDHDLSDIGPNPFGMGEKDRTGADIARYLVNKYPDKRPQFVRIHSWNDVGAHNIYMALRGWGVKREIKPFGDVPSEDAELNKIIDAGGLKAYGSQKRILVLDDDPERHDAFEKYLSGDIIHAHNYREAREALENNPSLDVVYLDHDIEDYIPTMYDGVMELTGNHVAKYIAEMEENARPLMVIVHSANPDGAKNIMNTLRSAGVPCRREPFGNPFAERDYVLWEYLEEQGRWRALGEVGPNDYERIEKMTGYTFGGGNYKVLPLGERPEDE